MKKMTMCPCWTKEDGDCAERRVGCRSECEKWQAWKVIHDREMEKHKVRKARTAEGHGGTFRQQKRADGEGRYYLDRTCG